MVVPGEHARVGASVATHMMEYWGISVPCGYWLTFPPFLTVGKRHHGCAQLRKFLQVAGRGLETFCSATKGQGRISKTVGIIKEYSDGSHYSRIGRIVEM